MSSALGRVTLVNESGRTGPMEVVIHPLFTGNRFPLETGQQTHPPVGFVPRVMTGHFAEYINRRFIEWTAKLPDATSRFVEESGALAWRAPAPAGGHGSPR